MLPFYRKFATDFKFGNPNLIESSINRLFDEVGNKPEIKRIATELIPLLEQNTPDMDDYSSELMPSLALDTVAAILSVCDFVTTEKDQSILDVQSLSLNSAEFIDDQFDEFSEVATLPDGFSNAKNAETKFSDELSIVISNNSDTNQIK